MNFLMHRFYKEKCFIQIFSGLLTYLKNILCVKNILITFFTNDTQAAVNTLRIYHLGSLSSFPFLHNANTCES